MAKPERPTAVLVIAILNFVFGGWRLVNGLCGGAIVVGLVVLFNFAVGEMRKKNPADAQILEEMMGAYTNIPGFVPFLFASLLFSLVSGVVLIVTGIGLLRMRRWARVTLIVYAVVAILAALAEGGYSVAVVSPGVVKANQEFQDKMAKQVQGQGRPAPPANPFTSNPMFQTGGAIAGTIIGCVYPIVVLVIMLLPNVREAFARGGAGGDKYKRLRDRDDDATELERRSFDDPEY